MDFDRRSNDFAAKLVRLLEQWDASQKDFIEGSEENEGCNSVGYRSLCSLRLLLLIF
jgi:hypothetical protein